MKSDPSQLDMRKSVEVQVDSDFALLLPSGAYEIKKMEPRRRLRSIVFICLMLAIAGIIGFGYFCPDQVSVLCTPREKNVLDSQPCLSFDIPMSGVVCI